MCMICEEGYMPSADKLFCFLKPDAPNILIAPNCPLGKKKITTKDPSGFDVLIKCEEMCFK